MSVPEPAERGEGGVATRTRERAVRLGASGRDWLDRRRSENGPIDLVVRIWERDHGSFGSVLGSAVAFRLFLFLFALIVLIVGLGALVLGQGWFGDGVADELGLTGAIADEVDDAFEEGKSAGWLLAIGGLVTTAWAGRNLAVTLTAASASAWRLARPPGMTSVRTVGVVIGLAGVVMVLASVLRLVKGTSNLVLIATSVTAVFLAYAGVWFALSLVLPRATRDPSSLLPGAALVGATFAALGWVSQFYLAPRLESSSELLGGLGIAAVALGWLFIASRIMVASLAVNAVLYERLGSLLEGLLSLPGLGRLRGRRPVRWLLEASESGSGAPAGAGAEPPA